MDFDLNLLSPSLFLLGEEIAPNGEISRKKGVMANDHVKSIFEIEIENENYQREKLFVDHGPNYHYQLTILSPPDLPSFPEKEIDLTLLTDFNRQLYEKMEKRQDLFFLIPYLDEFNQNIIDDRLTIALAQRLGIFLINDPATNFYLLLEKIVEIPVTVSPSAKEVVEMDYSSFVKIFLPLCQQKRRVFFPQLYDDRMKLWLEFNFN